MQYLVWLLLVLVMAEPAQALESEQLVWFRQKNYAKVIESITLDNQRNLSQFDQYVLYRSLLAQGRLAEAEKTLAYLEAKAVGTVREIVFYEKLNLVLALGNKPKFLQLVRNIPAEFQNPELLDRVRDGLLKEFSDYPNGLELKEAIASAQRHFPELTSHEGLLLLSYKSIKDIPELSKQAQENLLRYADFTKLPVEIQNQLFERLHQQISLDLVVSHYQRQLYYRNYSLIIKEVPSYFVVLKEEHPQAFVILRELYLESLLKKKQISEGLRALETPTGQLFYPYEAPERLSWMFTFHLAKGNENNAKEIIQQLRQERYLDLANKHTLELATYYFHDDQFVQSLEFYNNVLVEDIPLNQVEEIQWRKLMLFDRFGQRGNLIQIGLWAREHQFESDQQGARFCYWSVKLNLFLNDRLQDCYYKYPFAYYGLRALELSGESFPPLQQDPKSTVNRELTNLERYQLDFVQLLYYADESDFADAMLADIAAELKDATQFWETMQVYANNQRYYHLQQTVAKNYEIISQNDFFGVDGVLPLNYPQAFKEDVETYAKQANVPSALVYAVMREESRFRPYVKSPVGAIGLLQLMPGTAQYIGKQEKVSVNTQSLIQPKINLRLGAAYMRNLLNRFEGNYHVTLAAYNGGPTHAKRWLKAAEGLDVDYYVEGITFNETRNYVKRVLKSYYLYKRIYDQP